MQDLLAVVSSLSPDVLKFLTSVLQAVATVIAAIVIGVFGTWISKRYSRERDRQDKESQWRSHAIELTKLDLERKLKTRNPNDHKPVRPSVLDFLANYRDLQQLDQMSPKELYQKILNDRINPRPEEIPSNEKAQAVTMSGVQLHPLPNKGMERDAP
ncbi:MAG: hypothetical protein ACREX9_14950 [Gammaproteobacteria bacterium]